MRLETIQVNDVVRNAPAAFISVLSPNGNRGDKVLARLDTGADVTTVPLWCVKTLFLPFNAPVRLRMTNGCYYRGYTMKAAIEIWDGATSFGLFETRMGIVVTKDSTTGLLGMDVLGYLRLEGYGNEWTLSFPGGKG